MELNELIPAFAAKLEIVGLEARNGACALEIDGIPLEIVETAGGKALVTSAIIGRPPLDRPDAFLKLLLEANTETLGPQGAAFGMLPDTGEVILQWRVTTRDLELDAFCAELETFVNQV